MKGLEASSAHVRCLEASSAHVWGLVKLRKASHRLSDPKGCSVTHLVTNLLDLTGGGRLRKCHHWARDDESWGIAVIISSSPAP